MSRFHKQLNSARWRHTRINVICRDLSTCQICKRVIPYPEVDHITPLHRDSDQDPYDMENLQTLCKPCHAEKTRKELGHAPPVEGRGDWLDYVKSLSTQPRKYDET